MKAVTVGIILLALAAMLLTASWASAQAPGPPTPTSGPPPPGSSPLDWFDWLWRSYKELVMLFLGASLAFLGQRFWPTLKKLAGVLFEALTARLGLGRYRRFERRYLDWLAKEHSYLGAIPSPVIKERREQGEDLPVELERVYISLSLTGKEPSQTKDIERMATRARPSLWPWRRPASPPPVSDLALALDAHPRLVILGDPGSGKSTLLHVMFGGADCAE